MTKNIKTIALIAIFIVTGVGLSFTACQKEKNTEVKTETSNVKIKNVQKGKLVILHVEISEKGWKGEGHGKNKICVLGKGRCWIWHWFPEAQASFTGNPIAIVNKSEKDNQIILDFQYQYNKDVAALKEVFDLEKGLLIIEEDIIEEKDSNLLEFIDTPSPCIIPAGLYPIAEHKEGIKVVLPIIIK